MTKEQKYFIELYSFQKKNYSEIELEMNIDRKKLINLRDEEVNFLIHDIQNIFKKFTGKRKEAFQNFKEFYNWYKKQNQKCGYCGISQEDLHTLFNKNKRILPYLDNTKPYEKAPKRSSGTLEIERLDSSSNYNSENIILACPLCNNAKSNLIDEESWRNIFVPSMREYYESILNNKLKHSLKNKNNQT